MAIDPDREAIVTIGSKEGPAHLMLATLDCGDTVLVRDPSYPTDFYGTVIAGADIHSVPLVPGLDFFGEPEKAIRGSYPKPKMTVPGFSSNPTAKCVELGFFERVVALAKKHVPGGARPGLCRLRVHAMASGRGGGERPGKTA